MGVLQRILVPAGTGTYLKEAIYWDPPRKILVVRLLSHLAFVVKLEILVTIQLGKDTITSNQLQVNLGKVLSKYCVV